MTTKNNMQNFDLLIIGAGPAGYTASIYASRYKISNAVIGKTLGGYVLETPEIYNYPGFNKITSADLMQKMKAHTESFDAQIFNDEVIGVEQKDGLFVVKTVSEKKYSAKTLLLAIGTKPRKLNIINEDKFFGKGLSYCFTCDGFFFKNKVVAVVGGSDAANTATLYLSRIAKKVYQIYRGEKLRGETGLIDEIKNNDKIEVLYNTNVLEAQGHEKLTKIILDKEHNNATELALDGLFIEIGSQPNLGPFKKLNLKTDKNKFIETAADQSTTVPNIWAAGDITTGSNGFRQIICACSEAAIAVANINKFLK